MEYRGPHSKGGTFRGTGGEWNTGALTVRGADSHAGAQEESGIQWPSQLAQSGAQMEGGVQGLYSGWGKSSQGHKTGVSDRDKQSWGACSKM